MNNFIEFNNKNFKTDRFNQKLDNKIYRLFKVLAKYGSLNEF